MNKRYKIMTIALGLLLTLLVLMEALKPSPVNWNPSYSQVDKIPFGSYIFYNELKQKLEPQRLEEVNIPPFEFLMDSTSVEEGTYFFMNSGVYFGEAEANKLLKWVGRGNTLFISANGIDPILLDTLSLKAHDVYEIDNPVKIPLVNLSNKDLKTPRPYKMDKDIDLMVFNAMDTLNTTVLGVAGYMNKEDSTRIREPKVNFIKVPFEDGTIILHTFPYAFTNYFMLQSENAAYTGKLLSYLPQSGKIYMDHYYKAGKGFNTSPLYIIFNNRYLKWSYYVLLLIGLLWVIFEGKRKQRYVPIIRPLPNQTMDFTRTIAGMYLEKSDNKSIAGHLINHFTEYLRSTYNVNTEKLNKDFIEGLSAKAEKNREEVKNIVDYIILTRQKHAITESELIKLNGMIEQFKTPS